MKRRLIRYALLAAGGTVVFVAVVAIIFLRRPGSLQDWIGSQLQEIANGYLNPKLSFTDLTYQYPLSVSLKNLHLTAQDPINPGHTIDIVACRSAEVSLAEIPTMGKPIVIQKIALDQPLISAVAIEPGSKKFVGFSDLVRGSSSSTDTHSAPKPGQKLSDVFRMRLVQINDGKILYNPRISGTVPMQLDHINTVLNIEPTDAGWYKLDTDLSRKPVFDLSIKGQLSLDSFEVKDADIKLLADLSRDKVDFLPPELQQILKQYEAAGRLQGEIMGSLPLQDPLSGQADVTLKIEHANVAMQGLRIPVEGFELDASYENKKVTLPKLEIEALGGSADLSGSLLLNDRLDARLRLRISKLVPEKLLADATKMSPCPAQVDLDLYVATSLLSLIGRAPPLADTPIASIALKDFDISTSDPANPPERLDVLACRNLHVKLNEPIISGKPIVVDDILLEQPVISAVSVTPGAFQFAGIPIRPASSSPARPTSAPSPATEPTDKLSDHFRVKSFTLKDAKVVYDPRVPGTARMCLNPINTTIRIDPDNPGTYAINAQITREPAFNLGIRGEIDLDNPGLQNIDLDLRADLTAENLDYLPPQLQLLIHRTGAKAKIDFHGGGSVALSDLSHANAKFQTDIQNIEVAQGGVHFSIKDLSVSAQLQDRKIFQQIHIAALDNVFDISGNVALDDRRDIDVLLSLKDIKLEPLLAAFHPDRPALQSSTSVNAEIELKSPLMVALGAIAKTGDESVATIDVRELRLTTSDPLHPNQPLDFFACRHLSTSFSELPIRVHAIDIDSVQIDHPALRVIATGPQSKDFAGFVDLQKMAASQASPATAPSEASTTTTPSEPATKPSKLFHLNKLVVEDASLYYDPRIESESDTVHPTVPLSLDQIAVNVNSNSIAGDTFRFDVVVPSKQDFNLKLDGLLNIDTLNLTVHELDLADNLGVESPEYLPPQVQEMLPAYKLAGMLHVNARGEIPLLDPTAAELNADLRLANFLGTFGGYRFPVAHLRLPLHVTRQQIDFLDPTSLGGPTVEALGGTLSLTGNIRLNDRLDSTLALHIDGMKIQDFMACKIEPSKTEVIGTVHAAIAMQDAPIVLIAQDATPPPAPPVDPNAPPAPPPPEPPITDATAPPIYASDLPTNWGNATVDVTNARLAGLEVIQGISNIAKSAFANLFNQKDKPQTVVPRESAHLVFAFDKDRLDFSQIHYEGEVVVADGKGYVTLSRQLDLVLTGGLIQKLGGLGAVGNWIKEASDSLLYYHVYGSFGNIQYKVKRGDGKPITDAVAKGAREGEKYIGMGVNKAGEGIDQAGKFLGGLFGGQKKKQPPPQTQPSDQ
jgi:hypothetical protein